jgi:hypothetical protein
VQDTNHSNTPHSPSLSPSVNMLAAAAAQYNVLDTSSITAGASAVAAATSSSGSSSSSISGRFCCCSSSQHHSYLPSRRRETRVKISTVDATLLLACIRRATTNITYLYEKTSMPFWTTFTPAALTVLQVRNSIRVN